MIPDAERKAITALLDQYFDGLFFCDSKKLKEVLHPSALYATASYGELYTLTMDEYWPIVDARVSPAQKNQIREDVIENIEMIGLNTAIVRLRCQILPRRYVDLLSLVKIASRWWIISKVFEYKIMEY